MATDTGRASRSRTGRTLAVLFICAGIAFLGLLGDGDYRAADAKKNMDPIAGYYPADMPRYPDVVELPLGANTTFGRSKVRMSSFGTQDEPSKVASFYRNFWKSRKLWVRDDITHVGGVVSAVDMEHARVLQILMVRKGKNTRVFPSVTSMPTRALDHDAEDAPVPLFPESRVVMQTASHDKPARARSILTVNDGEIDANDKHYRQVLSAAGYIEEPRKKADDKDDNAKAMAATHRVLLYRHPRGGEITVNITRIGEKRVRVHIMTVGA